MARQGNMKFVGTIDKLIFYKWKTIYAVRTKPTSVKQTAATINQGKLFGIAVHASAVLRNLLKPVLPNAKDRKMMRRFEQAIVQWLRTKEADNKSLQTNLPFITGFDFNEQSLLHNRLKLPAEVAVNTNKTIVVQVPALQPLKDIAAPANTSAVICTVSAAAISLLTDDFADVATKEITIAYNDVPMPAQEIELPVVVDAGTLAVVVISLHYIVNNNIISAERWLPAGIAGSVWGG